MFDAEKAFNDWKKALRKIEAFEAGIVADLELQLRDTFETLKSEGMPEEEAFRQAVFK